MFQSLRCISSGIYNIHYHLIDSEFDQQLSMELHWKQHNIAPEVILTRIYSERNLPIATNIARYYYIQPLRTRSDNWSFTIDRMKHWSDLIDQYFPDLNYGCKIYPCVVRQFYQHLWSGLHKLKN